MMNETLLDVYSFLGGKDFLVPFLSTLMASITVLLVQHCNLDRKERQEKLYAISYVLDVAYRELFSVLLVNVRTIKPHIEAVKRILQGDENLLTIMFETNEFDILKAPPHSQTHLLESYKVLIGSDDIELVSQYEAMMYEKGNDIQRQRLNDFVEANLSSELAFQLLPSSSQRDILLQYQDILERLEHEYTRSSWFLIYCLIPAYIKYAETFQFLFFKKQGIKNTCSKVRDAEDRYRDGVPSADYMAAVEFSGIQQVV